MSHRHAWQQQRYVIATNKVAHLRAIVLISTMEQDYEWSKRVELQRGEC